MYQFLEWDTRFFGFGIASISSEGFSRNYISPLLTTLKIQGIKLAYCFLPPADFEKNQLALQYGGFLADEKITFGKKPETGIKNIEINSSIIKYSGPLNQKLIDLSIQTSHKSRFRVDPNFPAGMADKLYTEWIKNSLSGGLATDVFTYCEGDNIFGLITLSCQENKAIIGLLGVDNGVRGKGIGKALIRAAEDLAIRLGIQQLEVVTQKANLEACKFYSGVGFNIISIVNVYHFWIDKPTI
jgi:dTDP-4-amino-4,6-dideoxy-D-galactose acyltransferase